MDHSYYCLDNFGADPYRDKSLVTSIPSGMDRQCQREAHNDRSTAIEMMKGEEPQLAQKERVAVLTSETCHDCVCKYSQVGHIHASSIGPELGLQDSW